MNNKTENIERLSRLVMNVAAEGGLIPTTKIMTPTWEETAVMLVAIMEGTGDTAWARSEIIRMGKIIDQLKTEVA